MIPSPYIRVTNSAELRRIVSLPRRVWDKPELDRCVYDLTQVLRQPTGEMVLRPVQGQALIELGLCGGMFGIIRVGAGKTLISFLAATVAFAERPLLLLPAKLLGKTVHDWAVLQEHWRLPNLQAYSYERLGRAQAADMLENYRPDLIVCDEVHKLKNRKAAVTRRVSRYMRAHPETLFVALSGTITKRSLRDYAHILHWTLPPEEVPIPGNYHDLEMWSAALDEAHDMPADPGALEQLCDDREKKLWRTDQKSAARQAYRRRLVETAGVVATDETPIDASIVISGIVPPKSASIHQAFKQLRTLWQTPDEWPIADGLAMTRHARELALGFYYVWDPRPPREWLRVRQQWSAFVREKLSRSRTLDSELQVRRKFADSDECREWLAIRDTFEPTTKPIWLDPCIVHQCHRWLEEHQGIVWTEHLYFGRMLAKVAQVPFFSRHGQDEDGNPIERHAPGAPMVCSIQSNCEGRNLQGWSKNLVVGPPASGATWEQLLGRTHRDGQRADEIQVDVLINCTEHVSAFWRALDDAKYIQDSTGSPQKLLLADVTVPRLDDIVRYSGAQWDGRK